MDFDLWFSINDYLPKIDYIVRITNGEVATNGFLNSRGQWILENGGLWSDKYDKAPTHWTCRIEKGEVV